MKKLGLLLLLVSLLLPLASEEAPTAARVRQLEAQQRGVLIDWKIRTALIDYLKQGLPRDWKVYCLELNLNPVKGTDELRAEGEMLLRGPGDTPLELRKLTGIRVVVAPESSEVTCDFSGVQPRRSAAELERACRSRLLKLGHSCMQYAARHQGQFPGTLEKLTAEYDDPEDLLHCPASGEAYCYVPGLAPGGGGDPDLTLAYCPCHRQGDRFLQLRVVGLVAYDQLRRLKK